MKFNKRSGLLLSWIAGVLLLFSPVVLPDIVQAEVMIIANESVPVSSVSKEELEKIYTGKQVVWRNGQSIKPALLEDGQVHKQFVTEFIGKTTNQFVTYWRRMVFTGQGIQPRTFDSVEKLIGYVAETPGAVGYIATSDTSPNTKTLSVTGK